MGHIRDRRPGLLALLLALGPSSAACAQAPAAAAPAAPAAGAADEAAARAAYEKGTAAYALGDFAEAAKQYEAAFRLKLDPALLYNAAQAHRRANNRARAIELYENLLRVFPNAPNRDVARQHLDELKKGAPAPAGVAPGAVRRAVTRRRRRRPRRGRARWCRRRSPRSSRGVAAPAVAVEQSTSDRAPRPLYKKPWFWGAVAGVVLVGVVTAVAVSAGDDPAAKPSWGRVGEPVRAGRCWRRRRSLLALGCRDQRPCNENTVMLTITLVGQARWTPTRSASRPAWTACRGDGLPVTPARRARTRGPSRWRWAAATRSGAQLTVVATALRAGAVLADGAGGDSSGRAARCWR